MPVVHQMRKLGRSRTLTGLLMGATALVAVPAFAADNGPIETVVVTAQFTEQNLQTTPLSISAVTGADLEQRGISDLSELKNAIPNLTLNKTPAAFGSGVQTYIRGVGQYDTAFAAEPGVGMYIDDVYYGTLFGSALELFDLSRVEVLRGPQGVLGGKNNIGGAIRLVSAKPTDDNGGTLSVTYGSRNEIVARGTVNFTVIPDHLFGRVSAVSRTQDGYVDVIDYACRFGPGTNASGPGSAGSLPAVTTRPDCKVGTQGGTNVQGARLALRAVFGDHIEDNFAVDVLRDNSETQAGTLMVMDNGGANIYVNRGNGIQTVPRATFYGVNSNGAVRATGSSITTWNTNVNMPTYGIPWDQRFMGDPYKTTYATYYSQKGLKYSEGAKVHDWGLSNAFDWDVMENVHFRNVTGYRHYIAANSNDSDVSPMSFQLTTSYPENTEFQDEARFTGKLFDDKLEWTAGAFYYHRDNHQHGPVVIDGAGAGFLVFEQNDTYRTTSESLYAHAIYHLWDDLEFFGGFRYTRESKTYYFDHSGAVPGYAGSGFFRSTVNPALDCNLFAGHVPCDHTISPALAPHTSRTGRPDWRAGLDYHLTDDVMFYFDYSTGYRTGGTNSRPFSPNQLDSYGPEQLVSYEVGAKTSWFDRRLQLNVALFKSDYTNTITPLSAVDPGFPFLPYVKYVNLGSSQNQGIELEATAAPIDNMLIDGSFSYLDFSANPVPGAVPGWLDGCSASAQAAGICPSVAAGTVRVGSPPILFPKMTAHIGAQYVIGLNDAGTLIPRLDWNYQSRIYQSGGGNRYTSVDPRGLVDARLTWQAPSGGWQLQFAVDNLADEKYFVDVFDLSIFNFGSVEAQPGTGREWSITLKKAF